MIKISPSILSSDYGRLSYELQRMEQGGADMIHVDVMDGHFVPNITLGAPVVKSIRKETDVLFDVHLMISDPLKYLPDFVKAGADIVTFHLEAGCDADAVIDAAHAAGVKVGLAIKPDTPARAVFPYLPKLDMVLVMTVEPGFGGQGFIYEMLPKVKAVRAELNRLGLDTDVQVDGGINEDTVTLAGRAGANVFVAGNAIFSKPDAKEAIAQLRSKAQI